MYKIAISEETCKVQVLTSPIRILKPVRPLLEFPFRTLMFVSILVDLLLPIWTTRLVWSEINQQANSAAAVVEASNRSGSPAQDLTRQKKGFLIFL